MVFLLSSNPRIYNNSGPYILNYESKSKSSNDREDVEREFFRRFKIAVEILEEHGLLDEFRKRVVTVATNSWSG